MAHIDKCPVCNSVIDCNAPDLSISGFECMGCGSVLKRKKPYFWPHIVSLILASVSGGAISSRDWRFFTVDGFFYLLVFVLSGVVIFKVKNKSAFNVLWKSRK